jgi:Protein of unknown function (DUF3237)
MSGGPIPRAVELITTLLIPKKSESPERLKKGIINTDGVVSGSGLNGHVRRASVKGEPSKRAIYSTTAEVTILADDGAEILMIDRGEWRGSKDAFARFMANQMVAPSELYMVGVVRFQTSDPRYTWLKEGEFLSHAVGEGDHIKISVYRSFSPKARMK